MNILNFKNTVKFVTIGVVLSVAIITNASADEITSTPSDLPVIDTSSTSTEIFIPIVETPSTTSSTPTIETTTTVEIAIVTSTTIDNTSTSTSTEITTSTPTTTSTPVVIDTSTPSITTTSTPTSTEQNTSTSTDSNRTSNTQINIQISSSQIDDTVTKLINFLKSKQDIDGKISDINTSDWSVMAFGAKNIYASDINNGDKSLYNFIYNTKIEDLEKESNKCAAYSRHILALLSSGVPKTDQKMIELKNKLNTNCVQNNIFGLSGINDDVFGLIAAIALDEDQNSPVVAATLNTIKADQQTDGSFTWDGWSGADMTGAAINALKYAQNKGASVDQNVFTKAKQYLKLQQLTDGGWGFGASDALTTSWATMGINALGETQNDWFNSAGKNPWNVLTALDGDHYTQSWDGGIDWFGTKHAVPALLGNSWPIILDPKTNTINQISSGASEEIKIPTSTITTTSTPITTSTLITTTTLEISTSTTSTILTTTTPEIIPVNIETFTIAVKEEPKPVPTLYRTNKNTEEKNNNEELKSASSTPNQNQIIDDLPLDTPTKRTAKKVLAISGGSALVVGAYLGLRLLRNVV